MFEKLKSLFRGKEIVRGPLPSSATTTSQPVRGTTEFTPARELLKKATKLKGEKRFEEACEMLKRAYAAPDANFLMIEDRLRLPMYLQLAGKNDEGWGVLNELNITYVDGFSQPIIAKQCRIFLEKEGKFRYALVWAAWEICKELERDQGGKSDSEAIASKSTGVHREIERLNRELREMGMDDLAALGEETDASPGDAGASIFQERIEQSTSAADIENRLSKILKKLKATDKSETLAEELAKYLTGPARYDFREISRIVGQVIGN